MEIVRGSSSLSDLNAISLLPPLKFSPSLTFAQSFSQIKRLLLAQTGFLPHKVLLASRNSPFVLRFNVCVPVWDLGTAVTVNREQPAYHHPLPASAGSRLAGRLELAFMGQMEFRRTFVTFTYTGAPNNQSQQSNWLTQKLFKKKKKSWNVVFSLSAVAAFTWQQCQCCLLFWIAWLLFPQMWIWNKYFEQSTYSASLSRPDQFTIQKGELVWCLLCEEIRTCFTENAKH